MLFLQHESLSHQQVTAESENKRKRGDDFFKCFFHHQLLSESAAGCLQHAREDKWRSDLCPLSPLIIQLWHSESQGFKKLLTVKTHRGILRQCSNMDTKQSEEASRDENQKSGFMMRVRKFNLKEVLTWWVDETGREACWREVSSNVSVYLWSRDVVSSLRWRT